MTPAAPAPVPALTCVAAAPDVLAAAEAALTPAEREAYAKYTFEKRRRDWVLGRWAAKRAASLATHGDWAPDAVGVATGEQGRPLLVPPDERLGGWDLSLTHGHGRAAAIVAPTPIGVDLELVRAVPPNGWRFFLSEAERAWLADEPLGPDGEIVLWALKEAAYKALHGEVESMPALRTDVDVAARRAILRHGGPSVSARWWVADGFCLALACRSGDVAVLDRFVADMAAEPFMNGRFPG